MATQTTQIGVCQDRRCDKPGDPSRRVWYCKSCASCLCDVCWDLSPIHSAPGASRHEKLEYGQYLICNRLEKILKPPTDQGELEKLHDQDTNTTWFGIDRYEDGTPYHQDFETFSHLMADCPNPEQVKYPQLVSFVGETSAGKSTLVKMLIDQEESKHDPQSIPTVPSPVVGSPINDSVPTSADVHLYYDPATWKKERPILYADCEGLNAGERIPMGAHGKRIARLDNSRKLGLVVRTLEWADSDEKKTRQYAVTQIYPRLLYTFSDVVVFVLDKPKTFENAVLPKLFDWASDSLKASTNQGTLPHAVIALNFTDIDVNKRLWSVPIATEALLEVNKHVLEPLIGVPKLQKLADKWRRKGKRIHTIRDLIHCYYASFSVVRLPDEKDLLLLSKQISQLHTTIEERCELAYFSKKQARLLSSSDEFGFYIQQAFSHFARNLNQPFDFKEYALRRSPVPLNLGDHILRMAIALQTEFPNESGHWIFDRLSFMVASCFLYNSLCYQKGQPQDLFGDYLPNFENALNDFCSLHWPCEFSNRKGRCVNVSKRHDSKGHQNENGKVIAVGDYQSTFNSKTYKAKWMNSLKNRLHDLQHDLKTVEEAGGELDDPLLAIRKQHMENVTRFFLHVGGAKKFRSHATCLCCLMRFPEYALRCGHVLCSECINSFGDVKKTTIEMHRCPLHPFETNWERPWKIRMKPQFAGIRVLSLDGGGIRGIAELEVLRQIQRKLGVDIPIPAFFDLIVGTSTGGIIALALGVKQWSVAKCIEEFKRLCNKAFTPREFHGVWGLQHLATAHHGSIWETTPLYEALREALGTNRLFGGRQDSDTSYSARVAVTTSSEIATKGVVIANYCRKGTQHNYEFLRPNDPHFEMEMWEAGAATAAAAPYFKPFIHERTSAAYLDGAFHNNNPVKVGHIERQLLWTDVKDKPPDLFLSVGTSQDKKQVVQELKDLPPPKRNEPDVDNPKAKAVYASASKKWRNLAGIVHVGKAAYNRLTDVINCERQWGEFVEVSVKHEERSRYMRINPDIGRPPPQLDAKDEVDRLQADVMRASLTYRAQLEIEEVVFRLVASSFYFEKGKATRSRSGGTATVSGRLQCRFEKSSEWLKQLGCFFRKQQRTDFQPYFDIFTGQKHSKQHITLSGPIIERMASHGDFNIGEAHVTVSTTDCSADIKLYFFTSAGNVHGYPISGFPRDFLTEDDSTLRNCEVEEDLAPNEEFDGRNRARTARRIPSLDSSTNIAHHRSTSEQNLSTQPHLEEDDRRKSDEAVPRSTEGHHRSSSLRMTLKEKRSWLGLGPRRENDASPANIPGPSTSAEAQRKPLDLHRAISEPHNGAPSIVVIPTTPGSQHSPSSYPLRASTTPSTRSTPYIDPLPSLGFSSSAKSGLGQDRQDWQDRSFVPTISPVEKDMSASSGLRFSPNQSQGPWDPSPMYSDPHTPSHYGSYHPVFSSPSSSPLPPASSSYLPPHSAPREATPNPSRPSTSSHSAPRNMSPNPRYTVQQRLSSQPSSPALYPQPPKPMPWSGSAPSEIAVGNILRDSDDEADLDIQMAKKASIADFEKWKEDDDYRKTLERSLMYQ